MEYNGSMLYRMRTYRAVPEHLDAFNEFFHSRLLPVQLRHGARLVGRWVTEDGRIVAIWEYDDRESYERIEAAVRQDPDSAAAQQFRHHSLPRLFDQQEEVFMTKTVARSSG